MIPCLSATGISATQGNVDFLLRVIATSAVDRDSSSLRTRSCEIVCLLAAWAADSPCLLHAKFFLDLLETVLHVIFFGRAEKFASWPFGALRDCPERSQNCNFSMSCRDRAPPVP